MVAPLPAIDAHAHVFVRGLPLAAQRRYAPDYDAPLERYLEHLDAHGLTHGVLVQPSFLGADNSHLVAALKRAPARLRGIAVVGSELGRDTLHTLDDALDDAGIVGIRLNLVGEALPDLASPGWASLCAALRERAWSVEVQRALADAAVVGQAILDAGLDVVFDHFVLPSSDVSDDPGFARVLALGASGHAWVKLSAPYRSGGGSGVDGRTEGESIAARAYPMLRAAFGVDRLMWGSDWPHTRFERTQTYAGNRRFLDALVPQPAERERILAAPRALFRFTVPGQA
jgi:predicted TIM-barrel fold metal-dependent hydrolase